MRIARKVYMSIFTTLFILITCVATTFAWVGMFTTATLGSFDLNIKTQEVNADYFLKISNTGIPGTFDDSVNSTDVKRQILENMGKSTASVLDTGVNELFMSVAIMEPVTTDKNLENFYAMADLKEAKPYLTSHKGFYKFDLFLTVDTLNGIANLPSAELDALDINSNVFFENIEDALTGTYSTGALVNQNPFETIPSGSPYECLKGINATKFTVNTKNATRVAFKIYDPIKMTDSYTGTETPSNIIIYQGGKQLPNLVNNVYDLGGILPEEYNLALKEINTIYSINVDLDTLYVDANGDKQIQNSEKIAYTGAKERYDNQIDKEMIEANKRIWYAPNTISGTNYLGVQNGVQTKMKISVYFWYEGYDADCLRLIDLIPTSLELMFATDKKEI